MATLSTIQLPPISAELVVELKKVFTNKTITPASTYNDILYTAGQQSVIAFLEANILKPTIRRVQ